MKRNPALFLLLLLATAWKPAADEWITIDRKGYSVHFTISDQKDIAEYTNLLDEGIKEVNSFFKDPFKKEFSVYVHPDRKSLDSQWQKDWKMPEFKSECWMVASGVADKLDMIAPKKWDTEACEHIYAEKTKTQKLITHELFHIYHGQLNASPDFSNTENIDWLVEGFATYASGQCDSSRMAEVKKAMQEGKIPGSLDQFWTGKLKYGLSGSVVMYIDDQFGRKKLRELLVYSKKTAILKSLNVTEAELLDKWKQYVNIR